MVLDIILVVIFLVAAIWGAHKGGVKIIASLASFILAFVLAYTLADNIGNYIQETSIGIKIENAIETRIINSEEKEEISTEETQGDAITKIEEVIEDKVSNVVNDSKELVAEKVIGAVFYGIGFLTTFIGVKIVLFILFLIIGFIFKLPILKTFNKLIGCILEVILMFLKVWILLGIISFVAPLDFMQDVIKLINESHITKLLYEHNIIVSLIIGKTI